MKKSILTLLVVIAAITLTSNLTAQYSIPSFNVPVIGDPTTFEEVPSANSTYGNMSTRDNPFSQKPNSRGEKKMNLKSKDSNTSTSAWTIVNIYSLDGNTIYGPTIIYEDEIFVMSLDDSEEWGVEVVQASEGCEMDVWFE